jgi:co-chaperonin GroES (HSP10)
MAVHKLNGKCTASVRSDNDLDHIDYSKITLFGKQSILFVWSDELEGDEHTNASGIILSNALGKDRPRWGKVVKVGSASGVNVGDWILPESVTEPFGCVIGDVEHWRTTDNQVLLATDDFEDVRNLTGTPQK